MEVTKTTERARLQSVLRGTVPEERATWSAALRRRLVDSRVWRGAHTVMQFAAMKYEPDLLPLLEEEKRFAFPSLEDNLIVPRTVAEAGELVLVPHGIREPDLTRCEVMPPVEINLVLVPGLGFGRNGVRLGRGRGHYDRFLSELPEDTVRCGVCFDCQVSMALPAEAHDMPMHFLLTESGLTDCGEIYELPGLETGA